ncbi:MAG: GlsB/YeaQ/YmgE family stress response membrane protein [Candidatus Saccharimonadales bacterium]
MGILSWIIFGAIAGWLASLIAGNNKEQGAIGNIIVGIIGAAIGGWISGFLLNGVGVTGFNLRSFFVAVAGALILLFVKNLATGKK